MAYMISGFCAAVGSILYSARMRMGRPTLASTLLLDIVGANVIGGVSLAGGKGKVRGTFLGVLFFVLLSNTLSLLNLSYETIDIVKGFVILGACFCSMLIAPGLPREKCEVKQENRSCEQPCSHTPEGICYECTNVRI
jgi:ribose transport system permease protein